LYRIILTKKHCDHQQTRASSPFLSVFHFFLSGIVAPDAIAYQPIEILLNTEDKAERDELTRQWRDHKLEELNFVGIVVS